MIYLVALVVLVMATARLTRLIYFDDITIPMRAWIDRKLGQQSFISRMVWCPWCTSMWASLLTCAIATNLGAFMDGWKVLTTVLVYPPLVLAVAYLAGWIVDFETSRTSRGE